MEWCYGESSFSSIILEKSGFFNIIFALLKKKRERGEKTRLKR
jgi:hypothetical protein